MRCTSCGEQLMPGQRFCSKCGRLVVGAVSPAPAASAPPQYPRSETNVPGPSTGFAPSSRVARHLSALGVLWIIFSVLRLIPGLAMMIMGHTRFPFMLMPIPAPMRLFLTPFIGGIGLFISGVAIAGLIAGWGLMTRCPWARMLAIVLGCISLIHFPFGTALGIYTLWVLAPAGAAVDYQRIARAS